MQSNYRDWCSLSTKVIRETNDSLNAVEHVIFRSVCSRWRAETNQRLSAPLVILMQSIPLPSSGVINSFSFFDLIRRQIIPLHRSIERQIIPCSYYCGSSHGWLFLANVLTENNSRGAVIEELSISLLNPFVTDNIIQLPSLNRIEPGSVLLSHPPQDLYSNTNSKVVYYTRGNQNVSSQVSFLQVGKQEWITYTFGPSWNPDDIIAFKGQFFVIHKGMLREIDLHVKYQMIDIFLNSYIVPGMHPRLPVDNLRRLRFFQDVTGGLHLVCRSSFAEAYFILEVYVTQYLTGDQNSPVFNPSEHFHSGPVPATSYNANHYLMIFPDSTPTVLPVLNNRLGVSVKDFNPLGLITGLLPFWCYDPLQQHPWEPVGWITPYLRSM